MPKTIKPGEARFRRATDRQKACSTCGYFDSEARYGEGRCLMNVPEADFSRYAPPEYTCDYWSKSGPKPK